MDFQLVEVKKKKNFEIWDTTMAIKHTNSISEKLTR